MARIDDLLASIDGNPSSPATSSPRPAIAGFKRKAEDNLGGPVVKTPKKWPAGIEPARLNGYANRPSSRSDEVPTTSESGAPSSISKPAARTPSGARETAPLPTRLKATTAASNGNMHLSGQTSTTRHSAAASNGSKGPPARSSTVRPSAVVGGSQGQPKKRSYAEIMRQASEASKSGAQFGVIQHKVVKPAERGIISIKERSEVKKANLKADKLGNAGKPKREGHSIAGQRNGNAIKMEQRPSGLKDKGAPPAPEKKVRKAALATTGYTGTARPQTKRGVTAARPSSAPDSRKPSRFGGGVLARPRRHEDEYDDDLDDFIDDDEGEERRYVYEGESMDDESDMEAGIDDIDEEETRAERQARLEDLAEQALEKKMKQEKEARRRRALEGKGR